MPKATSTEPRLNEYQGRYAKLIVMKTPISIAAGALATIGNDTMTAP
jgi:hypothetical protein